MLTIAAQIEAWISATSWCKVVTTCSTAFTALACLIHPAMTHCLRYSSNTCVWKSLSEYKRKRRSKNPKCGLCGGCGPPQAGWVAPSHLVGLVAELTAERLVGPVRGLMFLEQRSAAEHLVAGGALVELFGVNFLHVLLMLLQRGEAEAAALAVVRLRHIWSRGAPSRRPNSIQRAALVEGRRIFPIQTSPNSKSNAVKFVWLQQTKG